jgi:hypothetical protein
MSPRLALLATAAALLCTGCKVDSDVGVPCVLVKKNPDGGTTPANVEEGDLTAGQDFISFGSVECDRFICVRDRAYTGTGPVDAGTTDGGTGDGGTGDGGTSGSSRPVFGYCSRPCVETQPAACEVTNSQVTDSTLKGRMGCRPLLLDQEVLDQLKERDPVLYEQTFGENASSHFCAGR